jgi:cation:H+ antiporter
VVSVDYLYLVVGLIGLFFGGEALVRGSVGIARRMAIPPLLIGLTVVGFGTSTPELLVSVDAAWRGVPDIALGNIVGSNIFNVLGILGVTALIAPIPVASRFLTFDLPVMIAVSLVLTALLLTRPVIGRGVGVAMLAGYVAYVWAAQG